MREKRKQQEGLPIGRAGGRQAFTIIEVLIVLAIAGLILLIVFLAVPALQRNSRNTGRKEDTGRIAAAINDFVSTNGTLPGTVDPSNTLPGDCPTVFADAGTLNQYSTTCLFGSPGANRLAIKIITTSYAIPAANLNELILVDGVGTCATSGSLTFTASNNAVLLYALEAGGGGNTWACTAVQ